MGRDVGHAADVAEREPVLDRERLRRADRRGPSAEAALRPGPHLEDRRPELAELRGDPLARALTEIELRRTTDAMPITIPSMVRAERQPLGAERLEDAFAAGTLALVVAAIAARVPLPTTPMSAIPWWHWTGGAAWRHLYHCRGGPGAAPRRGGPDGGRRGWSDGDFTCARYAGIGGIHPAAADARPSVRRRAGHSRGAAHQPTVARRRATGGPRSGP